VSTIISSVGDYNIITGDVDYDSGPYAVTFPAGMTSVRFDVPIINDNIVENDEYLILNIMRRTLPNGVTHGNNDQATVTILDDDGNLIFLLVSLKHNFHVDYLCVTKAANDSSYSIVNKIKYSR